MIEFFKSKCVSFYIQAAVLLLTVVGTIFFGISYTTGYNQIVYGENNSITITGFAVLTFAAIVALIVFQCLNKLRIKTIYNVTMFVLAALFTVIALLLLVDRVEAIGNCIVAPWDAGHGGEQSCYLAFVAIGCWLVSAIAMIVGSFLGYKKKD